MNNDPSACACYGSVMATGELALRMIERHAAAIRQLERDMRAEDDASDLAQFLAYESANFVYAFLLATGNAATLTDRKLRDDVMNAIQAALAAHGITANTFSLTGIPTTTEGPARFY